MSEPRDTIPSPGPGPADVGDAQRCLSKLTHGLVLDEDKSVLYEHLAQLTACLVSLGELGSPVRELEERKPETHGAPTRPDALAAAEADDRSDDRLYDPIVLSTGRCALLRGRWATAAMSAALNLPHVTFSTQVECALFLDELQRAIDRSLVRHKRRQRRDAKRLLPPNVVDFASASARVRSRAAEGGRQP